MFISKRRILASAIIGCFAVALGGCHKKEVRAPAVPLTPAPTSPTPPTPTSKPEVTLSVSPAAIEKGQSATLTWSATNATDVEITPGPGKVEPSGTATVSPTESTTYILTATGAGGSATQSARLTVSAVAPPPVNPEVSETDVGKDFDAEVRDAYFDFNKSDIREEAQQTLNADATFFKAHPNVHFTVEGHCDERGSEEYNLGLGERRAEAAKEYLVNLGIAPDRIFTISYGKERPQCTDQTEECWQKNRRAHLRMGQESK